MPVKSSWGVIICRRNAATGRPEALLVHKRYTYAFSDFVHGRYACGRPPPGIVPPPRTVPELLDDMTREELFLVWSLEFSHLWYHVWLTCENRELYNRKNIKFQASFMRDGGKGLRALVERARAGGVLLWEVPKGRRLNTREADVICSVRETREETGVDKPEYRLLPGVKRRVSYVSGRVRYVCVYYIAMAYPRLANSAGSCARWLSALRNIHQMAEVSEVRWYDVEQLRMLDAGMQGSAPPGGRNQARVSHLEALLKPAFRLMKVYARGRWASRRANPHLSDDCDAILRAAPPDEGAPPAIAPPAIAPPASSPPASVAGPDEHEAQPIRIQPRRNGRPETRYPRYPRSANAGRGYSRDPRPHAVPEDASGWCTVARRSGRKNDYALAPEDTESAETDAP
jgi:ADP-ribose pyrophosphatase YjhB (NUDIX family)